MQQALRKGVILGILAVSSGWGAAPAGEQPDRERLLREAEAAIAAWQYPQAKQALSDIAAISPDEPAAVVLRMKFLLAFGTAEQQAELAGSIAAAARARPEALAGLSADDLLRTGQALLDAGKPDLALVWILAGARRIGPDSPARYADSLRAWAATSGNQSAVSMTFASQMAGAAAARQEHAAACDAVIKKLPAAAPAGEAAGEISRIRHAAALRAALLRDNGPSNSPPPPPLAKADAPGIIWSANIGTEVFPERFQTCGGLLLAACQPAGHPLAERPLAAVLLAVDLATGRTAWRHPVSPAATPAAVPAAALVSRIEGVCTSGENIYVLAKTSESRAAGASRQLVETAAEAFAIDAAKGTIVWRVPVNPRTLGIHTVEKHVLLTSLRAVNCLAAADGTQLWAAEFPNGLGTSAVAGGLLVVPGWQNTSALNAATGQTQWTAPRDAGTGIVSSLLPAPPDRLVMITRGQSTHDILCLRTSDGGTAWSKSFSDSVIGTPEIPWTIGAGRLVAARGGLIRAIELDRGANSWQLVLPSPEGTSAAGLLGQDNRLLWSVGHTLAVLDAATGSPLCWSPTETSASRPLWLTVTDGSITAVTLDGLAPGTLVARRMKILQPPITQERGPSSARTVLALAGGLVEEGNHSAAQCLLDIAAATVFPGDPATEMAFIHAQLQSARASSRLEQRGTLLPALVLVMSRPERDQLRELLSRAVEDKATHSATACQAAATLLLLGDERGSRYLCDNVARWTGERNSLNKVLSACRGAGTPAQPVLIAGLSAAEAPARTAMAEQLAAFRGPGVTEALQARLADGNRDVRAAAAGSLATISGPKAAEALREAHDREEDLFTRNRLRRLLASIGHPVEAQLARPVGPRPGTDITPQPPPEPTLNREQALQQAAGTGKVLWSREDPGNAALLWIAVEGKFLALHSTADGRLTTFTDFLNLVGRKAVTVTSLGFSDGSVWAGTDKGAFVYDRRTKAWSQLVINLDFSLLDVPVESIQVDAEAGIVSFTLTGKGRFALDTRSRKWRRL